MRIRRTGSVELLPPLRTETAFFPARRLRTCIAVNELAKPGPLIVNAYALYYVCENKGGQCRYLRKYFTTTIIVDPNALTLR